MKYDLLINGGQLPIKARWKLTLPKATYLHYKCYSERKNGIGEYTFRYSEQNTTSPTCQSTYFFIGQMSLNQLVHTLLARSLLDPALYYSILIILQYFSFIILTNFTFSLLFLLNKLFNKRYVLNINSNINKKIKQYQILLRY